MEKVSYLQVTFTDVLFEPSDIPKLRGFFSRQYPADHLFHNHLPDNVLSYKYPLIQYRIVDGHPALIGLNEGLELMKTVFFDTKHINLNGIVYSSLEKEIKLVDSDMGISDTYQNYSFISPWMALNEDNYNAYINSNPIEQNTLLRRILKNNLKSLAKGLNYWIEDFDTIQIDGWFKPVDVNFKNIKMRCFKGEFTTNFQIPDILGLGKQSARGFGVIKSK